MPKIKYQDIKLRGASLAVVQQANTIIAEYEALGYGLTLRQLYYQFVSRDLIPNNDREYKRLGSIINDARLAGLIDWNAITDRTRNLRAVPHWATPGSIIQSAADSYRIDKWRTQPYRPEVHIEKDALIGVIENVCEALDVPYFSCRGYTSQSEMWATGQRMRRHYRNGQTPIIFHLGDHDPSGKDMTRDIDDRLDMFAGGLTVERLALNFDQITQYSPPPNPAKLTDSRATAYVAEFGFESWELDALEPTVIADLIENAVLGIRDETAWQIAVDEEEDARDKLSRIANRWDDVEAYIA